MKLSTCIRRIREVAKSLKIDTNNLEIEAKEKDCISVDPNNIILLFQAFYIYTQIFVFLAIPGNKL